MALSVVVIGSIGIGFAFIRDYFDTSLKDVDEAERYPQIPCLSVIPSVTPGLDPSIGYSSHLWVLQESLSTGARGVRGLRRYSERPPVTDAVIAALSITI